MGGDEEPTTQELRLDQIRRSRDESARAEDAGDDVEARKHARRAERADYLAERLDERERAEAEREARED